MNILMIIIGFLALIAGIVVPIILQYRENEHTRYGYTPKKVKKTAWIVMLLVGVMLFMVGHSFEIIPTGYTGVRTTFGQISQDTVPNGLCWKVPFVQDIKQVNNKQQDATFESEVWGETTEKTPVYASEIVVTYQINAAQSAWIFANITDTDRLITQDIVASSTKSAMVELSVNDVTNRAKIEPLVKEKLTASINEKYGEDTVTILKVVINQMDFEQAYNDAINQRSLAQKEQERQAIENQTAIAKAEADKQVAITTAQANAEKKRIEAEANAAALLIEAEAEAEANKKISESLTEEVIENKTIEKWDGKLPTVTGDSGTIIDIGNLTGDSNNP